MKSPVRPLLRTIAVAMLLASPSRESVAQSKSLFWRALDVQARLDADGRLRVVERQAMVFTGDWNGGERAFRLFPGQRLSLNQLSRIDSATDDRRALSAGDLSTVDRYAWKDSKTLRWRSRLPSDPLFAQTEIVYEIDYTLSGVLSREGDAYLLDHDFAFPDRDGVIERFRLDVELDPSWRADRPFPLHAERTTLAPGESFVVKSRLSYQGSGRPAAALAGTSPAMRWGIFGVLAAGTVLIGAMFRRREAALGRFAPLAEPSRIDADWLKENLLSLRPEEAGALWDESVGAPEVAAVLARLTAQKKIQTHADGKKMTIKRLAPLEAFEGYERQLVSALFFGGREATDSDAIKAHYRSSGFDPAEKIRSDLEKRLQTHGDFNDRAPRQPRWPTAALFLGGVALVAGAGALQLDAWPVIIGLAITHAVLYAIGAIAAAAYRKRIDHFGPYSLTFLWVPIVLLGFSLLGIKSGGHSSLMLSIGLLLVRLAIVNNLFNLAKTRDGEKKLARRKTLAAARRYFQNELRESSPKLSDAWFPYVLAFGLGPAADRWFRAFGAAGQSAAARSSSFSSGASASSESSGGWSGGGGTFGGAGTSGSWAMAAGALAAGVSAPSSGGGGGGGGGGGSSGGGGGGGW